MFVTKTVARHQWTSTKKQAKTAHNVAGPCQRGHRQTRSLYPTVCPFVREEKRRSGGWGWRRGGGVRSLQAREDGDDRAGERKYAR